MTTPAHTQLGASSAHRWRNCPGSINAEEGRESSRSPYADEGTIAHFVASESYQWGRDAEEWLGDTLETSDGGAIEVTQEMVDAVRVYLSYICALADGADEHGVEQKFDLAPLNPPAPMFGTTDFYAVSNLRHHLDIVDLKYGRGVLVDAENNDQGRMYALGAWLYLLTQGGSAGRMRAQALKTVTIHIVQPRVFDEEGEPRITSETLTLAQLKEWGRDTMERARRTRMANAPRIPGDWCKFCRAQADCPEFRNQALAVAQLEFSQAVAPDKPALPVAEDLTLEQVGRILTLRGRLSDWLDAVVARAMSDIERGRVIPGWALAPKRATRKWVDPEKAVAVLIAELGAEEEELYDRKVKSPAQVEKMLGKGGIPEGLVTSESSGLKLVPSDSSQALPPASEFTALRRQQT